ncbi:MAG: hypothetical protein ACRCY9_15205 [Phycicoccus sp.]
MPSAPALLPRYTGRNDVLADLRSGAVDAIREGCAGVEQVVLVVATDRGPRHAMAPLGQRVGEHLLDLAVGRSDDVLREAPSPGHPPTTGPGTAPPAGLGPTAPAPVPWDASVDECRGRGEALGNGAPPSPLGPGAGYPALRMRAASSALVVVADGSARRGEKAPGHLDERASAFDHTLATALREADPAALLTLDPTLSADLLAHGRAPLQVAAAAMLTTAGRSSGDTGVEPTWRCDRVEVSDPFGVLHVVALLRRVG